MPYAKSAGAELYYEVHGEGTPVAFAHGAGGNTLIWWQQVRHFARRHRVVLFDHRGFGRSRCGAAPADAVHFPDDLEAILDHAGIERASLVGQSMGGFTALRFAVSRPDRVSALVMAGTAGGAATPLVDRDRELVVKRWSETPRLEKVLAREFIARDPARAELYAQLNGLNAPGLTESIGETLWRHRVSVEALEALRRPVLFIVGTEDWFFRVETIEDLARRIRGARVKVLPGVGHSTYFEAPEAFNAEVGAFLADR